MVAPIWNLRDTPSVEGESAVSDEAADLVV